MSIAEIGTEFKFIGAELVEHSNMRPLSDWKDGDLLEVVAHVKMQGEINPLYWNARDMSSSTVREDLLEIIPATKPKPWSGPEDGLPPVGLRVECRRNSCVGFFEACVEWNDDTNALVRNLSESYVCKPFVELISFLNFRAIRTPEQIEADERSAAIREIMDAAGIDCLVTATRLVDAGFKREVV